MEWSIQKYEFRVMRKALDRQKLYKGDPRLLLEVVNKEGLSQAQLAKTLCIKPASLTVMIQRMEAAGLISRQEDQKDQRTLRVYATKFGKIMAKQVKDVIAKQVGDVYKALTEEELMQYRQMLGKLYERLKNMEMENPKLEE